MGGRREGARLRVLSAHLPALRIHISQEIERRIMSPAQRGFARGRTTKAGAMMSSGCWSGSRSVTSTTSDSPGRRAVDAALGEIMRARAKALEEARCHREQREVLMDVMRRFLRVPTTLVRCFPLANWTR